MARSPRICLSLGVLFASLLATYALAQPQPDSPQETREATLSRTRRVGHLERSRESRHKYRLKDVWNKQTYWITAGQGLDLEPFINRYVALHGVTNESDTEGLGFRAEKVVDLDPRRGHRARPTVARAVEQVDFEAVLPAQALEIELPSEALEPGMQIQPGAQVEPVPLGELFDVPTADGRVLQPVPDVLPAFSAPAESSWVRGEYLWWWTDGMRLPPLVTTSPAGTARASAGVLGIGGTQVLTPAAVNNDSHSGLRVQAGTWIDGAAQFGVGGDFYVLDDQTAGFFASSTGNPILARPFFDALNARETAELVAFPGVVGGTVAADARTEFHAAGLHLRLNLCGDMSLDCCGYSGRRLDAILGYRYARLADDVTVRENLTSQDPLNPGSFQITDMFDTKNEFHGGEVGVIYQQRMGQFMIEALSKLALGNNHQVVFIDGSTRLNSGGIDITRPGGILAQRTNMGRHVRDEFTAIPEVGVTVGYQLTPRLTLTLGYTLVYLSNVVRAGDQVDLDVNPNLFPPEVSPFVGPLRPRFAFRETDFWAQGFSVGGDFRW